MFITESGMIVRSPAIDLRPMGRNTQGVRLVNTKTKDAIVAAEIVRADDIEEEPVDTEEQAGGEPSASDVTPSHESEGGDGEDKA